MTKSKKTLYILILCTMLLCAVFSIQSEAKSSTYTVKNISSQTYKNRWGIKKISSNTLRTLAKIVYLEAGNQGDKGEQAVIEVIFNRVASKKFPNTIQKVLSQRNQFSTLRYINKGKVRKTELKNIYKVLSGKTKILSKKAVFFSRRPYNGKIELHYKAHYFCKY